MADNRSLRQKLQAMADQTESPKEAEIAKRKLADLGPEVPTERYTVYEQPYERVYTRGSSIDIDRLLETLRLFRTAVDRFEAEQVIFDVYYGIDDEDY